MPPKIHLIADRDNEPVVGSKGEAAAERILDAAFKSIAAKGYASVTLRGIADEAGVVLSQLNYYYGNKDRLFVAVLQRMQQGYIKTVDQRVCSLKSLEERIIALIAYNEEILLDSPETYRNFLEFSNLAMTYDVFRTEVEAFTSRIAALIEMRITESRTNGDGHENFSTAEVTRFILSASFGIALQCFLNPDNADVKGGFNVMKIAAIRLLR